jgi:hypothetical protein
MIAAQITLLFLHGVLVDVHTAEDKQNPVITI